MLEWVKKHNEIFLASFAFLIFVSNVLANVAMGLAVAYFLYYCYKEKPVLTTEYKPYFFVVGIFFLAILLSAFASEAPLHSIKLWLERWPWRFMLFVMSVLGLKKAEQVKNVLYAAFAGLSVSCIYMIFQYFALNNDRPNGFYGSAMMMGGILCEILPILMVMLLTDKIKTHKRELMVVSFLAILGLLTNGTRGAWLACLFTSIFLLSMFLFRKYKKQVCIGLLCLLFVGGFVLVNERMSARLLSVTNTSTNLSNTARLYMWRGAVAIFNDNPIVGVGEGQYRKNVVDFYMVPGQGTAFDHAHSIVFHMLAVNGLVGFLSMLLMFGSILWWNLKNYLNNENIWSLAIFASTFTLLMQGLTEYNIGQASIMKLYWLLLGCLLVLAHSESKGEADE